MHFENQNRIFILGNSGSGKTWLASALNTRLDLKIISLDEVCWEPGGYYKRRTEDAVESDLKTISQSSNWIIEGVYGDLAELLFPRLTHFLWLDLDPTFCSECVSSRGFENIPWMDSPKKIQGYLSHIESYAKNSGPMSREFHEHIFNSYPGKKIIFRSREDVNKFLEGLG
jgi:hypothetical protein